MSASSVSRKYIQASSRKLKDLMERRVEMYDIVSLVIDGKRFGEDGLEETLTLHRLGLHKELKRSFTTTNMIESVMSMIGQKTDKVDYWMNSSRVGWVE